MSIVAVGSDVNWNNIKTLASVSYSSNGGGNQDIGSIESININDVNGNVQIEANGNFADIGYYEIYIDTDNNANNGDNGSEYVVTNNGWTAEYIDGNWTNWNQIDVEEQNDKITVTVDKNVYNVHAVTYDGDWNILFSKDKGFDGNGGGNATVLSANGQGDTYALINSVLVDLDNNPDAKAYEVSDECKGDGEPHDTKHITQIWDNNLNTNVFEFHIHANEDSDRCINNGKNRQRTEIKTFDKSDPKLLGEYGNTVVYKWKFKLPINFKVSSQFTHLHQLKSKEGDDGNPLITLYAVNKDNEDLLMIRYSHIQSENNYLNPVSLNKFRGKWVEVTEKVTYSDNGKYSIKIEYVDKNNGEDNLLEYTNNKMKVWRNGAKFIRPKWGIYRAKDDSLSDEIVLFNDFSIEKTSEGNGNN